MKYLRFDDDSILTPSRTWTVRIGLDREVRIGEWVDIVDPADVVVAEGQVAAHLRTTIDHFVWTDVDGYPGYTEPEDLVDDLARYYPDEDLDSETVVDSIELVPIRIDVDGSDVDLEDAGGEP